MNTPHRLLERLLDADGEPARKDGDARRLAELSAGLEDTASQEGGLTTAELAGLLDGGLDGEQKERAEAVVARSEQMFHEMTAAAGFLAAVAEQRQTAPADLVASTSSTLRPVAPKLAKAKPSVPMILATNSLRGIE